MRPQPGNALQERRDASEKGECWKRTCGVRLVCCCSSAALLLLRVLARGGSRKGNAGNGPVEKIRRAPRGEVVRLV